MTSAVDPAEEARMVVQEILKIVRRRGMFWSALAVPLLAAVVVAVINLLLKSGDTYIAGLEFLDIHEVFISLTAFIMAALIGAQAGAYDVANGTFRYLVMTGRSRMSLYLARFAAFAVVAIASVVPALVVASLSVAIFPLDGNEGAGISDHVGAWWGVVLSTLVFGAIALGVGALLRSVGAAIAVALTLNLGATFLLPILTIWSDRIWDFLLPGALFRILDGGQNSLIVAVLVLIGWVGAFVLAGAWRTIRAEY
jgi:ABC-type transport system involved in multi-copper enzyme maturation permease subunit